MSGSALLLSNNRRVWRRPFVPSALFAAGEVGAWYDPSDLTTLFQDTAGTTPVTTPGQTVALMLDKSRGSVPGPELVTNGDFTNGTTGWTAEGLNSIAVVGGELQVTLNSALFSGATGTSYTLVAGRRYSVSVTARQGTTASNFFVRFGTNSGEGDSPPFISTASVKRSFSFTAISTVTSPRVLTGSSNGNGTFFVDNISVKELPGNHATQATAASRPTYGIVPATGRRNLLTWSEGFDNAAWTKAAATATANGATAPDGTLTADTLSDDATNARHIAFQTLSFSTGTIYTLSVWIKRNSLRYAFVGLSFGTPSYGVVVDLDTGLVTDTRNVGSVQNASSLVSAAANGYYRVAVSASMGAGASMFPILATSNSATPTYDPNGQPIYVGSGQSVFIWGAQLETGSTATAYQRVTTQWDVTEAGVQTLSYLGFDGVDDGMATASIDFTATDKMTVFAGVRKLSNTPNGTLLELSATANTNNGSFNIFAPSDSSPLYGAGLRGNGAICAYAMSSYTPPITNVIAVEFNIAGIDRANEIFPRINGIVPTLTPGGGSPTAGTGNFGNYPLFLGRRGGILLPFNGHIYGLIVRGAATDAGTITSTEMWLNGKSGAY